MNLADLGEFGLIQRIHAQFENQGEALLGIGDDCAVLPGKDESLTLVTTDMLVEDIHFLRARIDPVALGHKSLAVNLSDIAAMGGIPTGIFLSLACPKTIAIDWLDAFFDGFKQLADTYDCPLLGGDTTKSSGPVVINVAVLGTVARDSVKYRSGAKPGDVIAVTGLLGDSGAGLQLLLDDHALDDEAKRALVDAHHQPSPHLVEGQWLSQQTAIHAMMDVSDGLDSDLRHIMDRSGVGAVIDLDQIPLSPALRKVCATCKWSPTEFAVAAGEDYCLLCTIDGDAFKRIACAYARRFARPLFPIGRIVEGASLTYAQAGNPVDRTRHGFDHFKT